MHALDWTHLIKTYGTAFRLDELSSEGLRRVPGWVLPRGSGPP